MSSIEFLTSFQTIYSITCNYGLNGFMFGTSSWWVVLSSVPVTFKTIRSVQSYHHDLLAGCSFNFQLVSIVLHPSLANCTFEAGKTNNRFGCLDQQRPSSHNFRMWLRLHSQRIANISVVKFSPEAKLYPTMNDRPFTIFHISRKEVSVFRVLPPVTVQRKIHVSENFRTVGSFLKNVSTLAEDFLCLHHSFASGLTSTYGAHWSHIPMDSWNVKKELNQGGRSLKIFYLLKWH